LARSAPSAPLAPSAPSAQARTLRFADELTQPSQTSDPAPSSRELAQPTPKSVLRRGNQGSSQAAPDAQSSSCTALAPCRPSRVPAQGRSNGAKQVGPHGPKRQRALPEPELLVVRLLYLSRLPAGSWLQNPAQYQLSLHVGEDARNDPPSRPGPYSTPLVQAGPPQAVPPEEAQLRQRIASAVEAMEAGSVLGTAECRFKARVSVRLSDAGPGPAAGGPVYFRVDAWSFGGSLFGRPAQPELFARAFVPFNDAKYHRRACTWPMIDGAGKDVAFVTCEFSFARIPSAVQDLHAENVMANDVKISWLPPANEDRVVPLRGYRVDSRVLGRGKQPGQGMPSTNWQHAGDIEAGREQFLVQGLKPDTFYVFRVCAVNEVGLSEPEELEVQTGPCAPAGCGQPRLAGCSGPVLAVEWDAPLYDGGAGLVAYRVAVRPFSKTEAPDEWLEVGHVKHNPSGLQRAEIHTEDLDPQIGRYLCRVAAINAAGEVGPATPDAVSLTLPNPCAVSRPTPAPAMPLALSDREGAFGADMWSGPGGNNLLTMTINEPGKRKVTIPLFEDDLSAMDLPLGFLGGHIDGGAHSSLNSEQVSNGAGHDLALPDRLDATHSAWPLPSDLESRRWYHEDAFGPDPLAFQDPLSRRAVVPFKAAPQLHADSKAMDQQELLQTLLDEKRALLDASLQSFQQLTDQLSRSPESETLRQRQEEAEIEAAGLQAEIAVLSQKLREEFEAIAPSLYNTGNEHLFSLFHGGAAANLHS